MRQRFPGVRRDAAYLNTASYGLPPLATLQEMRAGLEAWADGSGSWREWEDRAEEARSLFSGLVGVRPERVAFVNSLSAAASQVAWSLPAPGRGGRSTIVVGEDEFRSNLFPWWVQEERGFRIRRVPFTGSRLDPEHLIAALDDDVALLAVSHVQSANGFRSDISRLARAAHAEGARIFVDGTQSVGAHALDLDEIDYLGVAAYKWLLAPRGAAFLVLGQEHLGSLAPLQPSWKTPADPYTDYYGGPFEPRGPQASLLDVSLPWLVWQGATASLELLAGLGLEAIAARDAELARRFREGLPRVGLEPLFEEHESSAIVALRVPNATRVQAALRQQQVDAAVRSGYLRASFHFYNDEGDVERALAALRQA